MNTHSDNVLVETTYLLLLFEPPQYRKRIYTKSTPVKPDGVDLWLLRGPLHPNSGIDQQIIVLEYQDRSVRYVLRTQQICIELDKLDPKHTLFIMQCV